MAKSNLEKQIEKQMKQAKQIADKQRRADKQRAREEASRARKEEIQLKASSIVNGQPIVEGIRIMDATAEEILKYLLRCNSGASTSTRFEYDSFPAYAQLSIALEMEKLAQYGMISGYIPDGEGAWLNIHPQALTYFDDKQKALIRQEETRNKMTVGTVYNYGNWVCGNVIDSTLSVDNSIHEIERAIEQQGGEDKDVLYALLEEVKELLENIETSRVIPKQKHLHQRLSDHMEKHGWFYGSVVQLLGTVAMKMIGG